MPSASIHSPGLVLDVNLAIVSTVAFVVLHADSTSSALARTNTPRRPFNVLVFMAQPSLMREPNQLGNPNLPERLFTYPNSCIVAPFPRHDRCASLTQGYTVTMEGLRLVCSLVH